MIIEISQKHIFVPRIQILGPTAQWLATWAWKPKVLSSSPAASYVQK